MTLGKRLQAGRFLFERVQPPEQDGLSMEQRVQIKSGAFDCDVAIFRTRLPSSGMPRFARVYCWQLNATFWYKEIR